MRELRPREGLRRDDRKRDSPFETTSDFQILRGRRTRPDLEAHIYLSVCLTD